MCNDRNYVKFSNSKSHPVFNTGLNKFKIQIIKFKKTGFARNNLDFENCNLFVICYFVFGALNG